MCKVLTYNVYMSKNRYIIHKYITIKDHGRFIVLQCKYILIDNVRYVCG